jgi:2-oxoglutarate ferredoxin oxidoreductase subunit beta
MKHILRAIDELKMDMTRMVFVSGIGATLVQPPFRQGYPLTLRGRHSFAWAKLSSPDLCVVVVSGTESLFHQGILIHATRRNIDLKVICANNIVYSMTGPWPRRAPWSRPSRKRPLSSLDLYKLVEAAGAAVAFKLTFMALINAIKITLRTRVLLRGLSCPTIWRRTARTGRNMIRDLIRRCILEEKRKVDREERGGSSQEFYHDGIRQVRLSGFGGQKW